MFVDEAYTLTSKCEKAFGKEAIELIVRYMLPSNGSVKLPVFIFADHSENMEDFLDTNIGLRQRIMLKFMFQDYSPVDLSRITLGKLLKCKIRFDVSYSDAIKYTKEDFQLRIKSLIDNNGMKTKYIDRSTQTPHEVCLHIHIYQELVLYLAYQFIF